MFNFWEELDYAIHTSVDFDCYNCPAEKYHREVDNNYIPLCYKGTYCGETLKELANTEVTHKSENRRAYD